MTFSTYFSTGRLLAFLQVFLHPLPATKYGLKKEKCTKIAKDSQCLFKECDVVTVINVFAFTPIFAWNRIVRNCRKSPKIL